MIPMNGIWPPTAWRISTPILSSTVEPGDIIVAGANFGCGSSREHAPLAIKASGVKCVIAASFARIFYRNAINIGFPIMECPEAAADIQPGDQVSVDFSTGEITDETTGKTYPGSSLPGVYPGHYRKRRPDELPEGPGRGQVKRGV